MKNSWKFLFVFWNLFFSPFLFAEKIAQIRVEGNARVEATAILNIIESKVGLEFDARKIQEDILALYNMGYFSDIRFFSELSEQGGLILLITVQEKPAITSIAFSGMTEISEEDLKDHLETKLYTIVSDTSISKDMAMIERKYVEKGFYLSKATYSLEKKGENDVALTFQVDENGKVVVADVLLLGNSYLKDSEIIDLLASKPISRWSTTLGAPSIFQDSFLKRDTEFIAYLYRDHGFAEIKVAQPVAYLDPDKRFVRIMFSIEEGEQFSIGSIKVSGDVGSDLYKEEELLELMLLKPEKLFRYSQFSRDVETLVDKYGDLGFAYVDVDPQTEFDREKKLVHLNYRITKGQRVYFGRMDIIGNTKTRDNIIRREFEVNDSELYSGTRLTKSKENVNRLGFFEEVQVIKERDSKVDDILNLKVKVKEKPTGQLQAAIGFSPKSDTKESFYTQGRYDEQNQSGRAYKTNFTLVYKGSKSYEIKTGFYNPKINDSAWSFGTNLSYERKISIYAKDYEVPELVKSASITVGRSLFELVRGVVTVSHNQIRQLENEAEVDLLENSGSSGMVNYISYGLNRQNLNNYIDPSEGSDVFLRQKIVGGFMGGDARYQESSIDFDYYYPLDFNETFRTFFKFRIFLGKLFPSGNEPIPSNQRYRLGGKDDLRGFTYGDIGPFTRRGTSVLSGNVDFNYGGDRKVYTQLEYFIPLIPQAGIKGLIFFDVGRVYSEYEPYREGFGHFKKDVGFGLRWITPIAPFRFEWAYPYLEDEKTFGSVQPIFSIGF